jgi:ABC-2 type transport system permease protein
MWTRIRALIVKEFLALLSDPRGRWVVVGPPLIQLVVFSYAATLEVKNADVAVLNRDPGQWGRELVSRIDGSPTFRRIIPVEHPAAAREALDLRRAIAVIHVGPSFSRDLEAGRPTKVQLVLDGRRSNASQIVAGYLSEIIQRFAADVRPSTRQPSGPVSVNVVTRNWFNPNLDFIWHMVPSLVASIALLVAMVVTALSVARERELGTFDQLMVSPLRTHEVLMGKLIPPVLIGLFHITLFICAAVFVFGVPLRGSLIYLYGSSIFYLAAVVGLGLFISSLSTTQQQAILGAFMVLVPAMLLSGFATPIENMPKWLQAVTLVNPLRYFLVIVKGVFLKALPLEEVIRNTIPLALIAVATLGSAAWLFRRRME